MDRLGGRLSLIAAGAAFACAGLAGIGLLSGANLAASAVLAGTMAAIAVADARQFRVPDPLVMLAGMAGFVWIGLTARDGYLNPLGALAGAALQMALCGGALLILREVFYRLNGVDGIGLGDVKLAAAGGIWLGWEAFAVAVLLASVGALVFVGLRFLIEGVWARSRRIPFALYLAPAIWVAWFAQVLLME